MTRPLKDVSKSVHTRLLNLAKETGRPFADLFRLYAMERFLYRLSRSTHAQKFVLKGGLMLRVWDASSLRPTKDVDLLGRTENSTENLAAIVREICALNFELDGITFDPETVEAALIKEDAEYNGVRVKFLGHLGRAEAPMQLDVGFGDAVVPAPVEIELPTLLDQPVPHLRAYQRETTNRGEGPCDDGPRHRERPDEGLLRSLVPLSEVRVRRVAPSKGHRSDVRGAQHGHRSDPYRALGNLRS